MIKIKRVYEEPREEDGYRILIDRLWPRGLSKDEARVNLWMREVSPSDNLRKWFGHEDEKWDEFKKKYADELKGKEELLHKIKQMEKEKGTVTILYSARNEKHNNAVAISEFLKKI